MFFNTSLPPPYPLCCSYQESLDTFRSNFQYLLQVRGWTSPDLCHVQLDFLSLLLVPSASHRF